MVLKTGEVTECISMGCGLARHDDSPIGQVYSLCLAQDVLLPGLHEAGVSARVTSLDLQGSCSGVISSCPDATTTGLYAARGLANVVDGRTYVHLANLTVKPVELKQGTVIGEFEVTGPDDLLMIATDSKSPVPRSASAVNVDLSGSILDEAQVTLLRRLLNDFSDVFAKNPKKPGVTRITEHAIDTGDAAPVNSAPHRASPQQRQVISAEIKEMKANGIIRESRGPWASASTTAS